MGSVGTFIYLHTGGNVDTLAQGPPIWTVRGTNAITAVHCSNLNVLTVTSRTIGKSVGRLRRSLLSMALMGQENEEKLDACGLLSADDAAKSRAHRCGSFMGQKSLASTSIINPLFFAPRNSLSPSRMG